MDFVRHAKESAAFYEQSEQPLGSVELYDEYNGDDRYKVTLCITQMGIKSSVFVEVSKISSTEIYVNTENYSPTATKFTKIR